MAGFTDEDKELIPALYGGRRQPTKPVHYRVEKDCWICTSHRGTGFGYPHIKIDKQSFSLPRWICLVFNGPGKCNDVVLHSCDNPLCINPEHLRMGSQKENVQQAFKRGRANASGENHHQTQLKEADVKVIRWASQYMTQKKVGEIYGLTQQGVSDIIRRKSWSHL